MRNIIKSQSGSVMLLMVFFVLASILIITLSLSAIAVNGLKLGTDQVQSTKAFFAAEAGAERILWEFRKNENDPVVDGFGSLIFPCNNDNFICYTAAPNGALNACGLPCVIGSQELSNNSNYSIKYNYALSITTLLSYGNYADINRAIELKF